MMKKIAFLLFIAIVGLISIVEAQQVEPPFWWTGMHNQNLQILIHKESIADLTPKVEMSGVDLVEVHKTSNPNYLFIDFKISDNAKPGFFNIDFYKGKKRKWRYQYELKKRKEGTAMRQGFDNRDVVYLLMPDRFANGNTQNDNIESMLEKADRSNPDGRHGGDIQGIANHLDYFNQLGVTAIWINPLLENNMPAYSYHGYAITDYYQVDPRFGSNQDYVDLVTKAKSKNIKIIMDMVFNHCGLNHWWMKDLPSEDWIHQFDQFTRSNYRAEALMDPHASKHDQMIMSDGWFDRSMPDLNQKNPFLAKYLIQNSIWWIEYAGLSGIRMDTYPYSDQDFMREWVKAVFDEYPNFNIVGEAWLQTIAHTAYFQNNTFPSVKKNGILGTVTDFPVCYAANAALVEKGGWTDGMAKLYMVLSQDFVYSNADSNLVFLDNHDINRFATNVNSDWQKWEMGMTFLLTTRGIPMLYYGGELMMEGDKSKGDADLRRDFPGGWEGDSVDAFTGTNLTDNQTKALELTKSLLALRNNNPALQSGRLTHFTPETNAYIYFRSKDGKRFMIVLNNNEHPLPLTMSKYAEMVQGFKKYRTYGQTEFMTIPEKIKVPAKSTTIFEFE